MFSGAVWKQTHLQSAAEDNLPVNTVQKEKEKKNRPTPYLAFLDNGCSIEDRGAR